MMMFAHSINVLTHDLNHQCRIADVSHFTTPAVSVDKSSNMASSAAVVAPYLQGKVAVVESAHIVYNLCRLAFH